MVTQIQMEVDGSNVQMKPSVASTSWADMVDEEENRMNKKKEKEKRAKRIQKKKRKENKDRLSEEEVEGDEISKYGKEIFVGGLKFDDLDLIYSTKERFKSRDERRKRICSMFERYGEVMQLRTNWTKGFIFVVFREQVNAQKVMNLLSKFEERELLSKVIESELISDGKSKKATPRPNYYLRWPHNYSPEAEEISQTEEHQGELIEQGTASQSLKPYVYSCIL